MGFEEPNGRLCSLEELFPIEGLKEGIASSLIVETVLHGMPRMDQSYQYEFQTGTFHVK